MVTTDNGRKVQTYTFDDNQRLYIDGQKVLELIVRTYDSGEVLVRTKTKPSVFSTCFNVMSSLIIYSSLAYTGFHLDEIKHQMYEMFDKKQDGLEQKLQHDLPSEYSCDNRKGQAVHVVAEHW